MYTARAPVLLRIILIFTFVFHCRNSVLVHLFEYTDKFTRKLFQLFTMPAIKIYLLDLYFLMNNNLKSNISTCKMLSKMCFAMGSPLTHSLYLSL